MTTNFRSSFLVLLLSPLLVLVSPGAGAYSVAPAPDLAMKVNGKVLDVLVEPDGHVLVAGSFSLVANQPRANLARLLPDGSLDTSWRFDANGTVSSLARSQSGQIYVAGSFDTIGGATRYGIARLDPGPAGMALSSWAPEDIWFADEVEVAAEGDVFVLDGSVKRFVAGGDTPAPSWGSGLMPAWDIAVSPDGEFVVTCTFYHQITKLTRQGALVWQKNWDGGCVEIEFAPNGDLFVARQAPANSYTQIISRIDAAGNLDPNWEIPFPATPVDSFAFLPSGDILVGTNHNISVPWGLAFTGDQRGGLYRFSSNGVLLSSNVAFANGNIETIDVLPGGDLLVSGGFSIARHQRRSGLARVSSNLLDLRAAPASFEHPIGSLNASLRLADGSYLLAGPFIEIQGQPRRFLAHLSPSFELLPDEWALDQPPMWMATDASGNCYLAGLFPIAPENSPSALLRLDGCSAIRSSWMPAVDGGVTTIVHGGASDDAIYAASCTEATTSVQIPDCRIQRFSASGSGEVSADWTLPVNERVIALLPKGEALFVGGAFNSIGGLSRNRLAKISDRELGILDTGWTAERVPRRVKALLTSGDDDIIVGGSAPSSSPSAERPALLRLNAETGLQHALWRPWLTMGQEMSVGAMALSPDGDLYFSDAAYTCCISRVRADGTVDGPDTGFLVDNDGGRINQLYPLQNGQLVLAGAFREISGQSRLGFARLVDVSPAIFIDQFE